VTAHASRDVWSRAHDGRVPLLRLARPDGAHEETAIELVSRKQKLALRLCALNAARCEERHADYGRQSVRDVVASSAGRR
jgi:hypothetical protein